MAGEKVVQRGYRITGRVQGVFFRVWTRDTASSLGLQGTVRNLPDGSVGAHFKGPTRVVEEMTMRLKEGPPASRVDEVEETESGDPIEGDTFEILF